MQSGPLQLEPVTVLRGEAVLVSSTRDKVVKDSDGRAWSEVKDYLILIIRRLCDARLVLIPYFLATCLTVSFKTSAPLFGQIFLEID